MSNIRVSIQPDKIYSIAKCYPELNTGWLLTGDGEMLKSIEYIDENTSIQQAREEQNQYSKEGFKDKYYQKLEELNEVRKEKEKITNDNYELKEKLRLLEEENLQLKKEVNHFRTGKDITFSESGATMSKKKNRQ